MEHNLEVVFVELLDEGTTCFRPVIAERLDEGAYRLLDLPEYRHLEEVWAVEPGTRIGVRAVRTSDGRTIPVAEPISEENPTSKTQGGELP